MLRICVSVAVVAMLTSAYVVNPFAGWVALGSTFVFLGSRRWKNAELSAAEAEVR